MSDFDALVTLISPPDDVSVDIDWGDVEQRLGFAPPTDYRQIVTTYGSGLFCSELSVWLPDDTIGEDLFTRSPGGTAELEQWREDFLRDSTQWIDPAGVREPLVLGQHPIPFYTWGGGASGAYGFWHRIGSDPESWPVLYANVRENVYLYHRGGLAGFIVSLFSGDYPDDAVVVDVPAGPDFGPYPASG